MSAGVTDQRMKGQGNQGMFGPSFGQQSYNYFPGGNGDYNTWGSQQINAASAAVQQQQIQQQQSRKGPQYDEYYRDHSGYPGGQDGGIKGVEQGMQGLGLEVGGSGMQQHQQQERELSNSAHLSTTKSDQPKETIPKKMTWASIASQPAKPQTRTNSSSSTLKKKGPGMPPPPMVPGKHNMDIGTWDSPSKNGPIMVPSPAPPVIVPPPIIEPSPLSQQKVSNNSSGGGGSGSGMPTPQQQHQQPTHTNAPQQHNLHMQQQHVSGPPMRPSWSGPNNNRGPHPGMMAPPIQQHQQRSNMGPGQGPPPMGFQGPPQQHSQPSPQQQQHMGGHHQSQQQHQSSMSSHQIQQQSQPPSHQQPPQLSHSQQQQQSQQPQPPQQLNNKLFIGTADASNNLLNPADNADNPVLEELHDKNQYNPQDFDFELANNARFFVIKSYSEDDIHRSIKYEIWCSTEHGNKRLDQAFREREKDGGIIFLLFSVNGSGHFCGMAQMMTAVDYNSVSSVWSQDKWKGTFKVKWIYVKDVPNTQLRHIRLENNENKSVTHSRDTQEVPNAQGVQVLKILSTYNHTTSIFDDFIHYEKRQEEEDTKKVDPPMGNYGDNSGGGGGGGGGGIGGGNSGGSNKYHSNYDKNHGYENKSGGYDRGNKGYGGQYNHHRGGGGGSNYQSYDNRRGGGGDDYRGFDRSRYNDGGGYNNRDGGGADFHRNRNNDFRNKDDRGNGNNGGYMTRDRDNMDMPMTRNNDRGGMSHHNRDRPDHHSNGRSGGGRGRGGGSGSSSGGGGYRN